ncbi:MULTISPECIES: MFS transporter [unclassified Pseudonocardia]|uniref:MFS transporter n=1 Tax=unclassified Pseudonocardia TaxID=2619320 RepID=UPI0002DC7481|nr:MFS transporter [Pseudonocardia sp. Ae707_Ps1]OLM16703.1 permease of the major facilitator superfamily [Pseudonocardia sp. Ae707_Ps1]
MTSEPVPATSPETSRPADPTGRVQRRRVAAAVLLGTTIEWYDFQIYGLAAGLVLGQLFFPGADPVAATLAAFGTFAVGFAARPLGGLVMGHFGDRLGRKKMLVLSLSMMGVATFLMGLLPTYASIGVAAPILMVLLRVVQGIGVGGEWGGAVLTAVEYADPKRRGLFGSLPQMGVPAGLFLATLAFLGVSQLPEEDFLSWGWRIPFLISIVLVVVGLFVRAKLEDTPVFRTVRTEKRTVRAPLADAVRRYPKQLVLGTGLMISTGAYFYIVNAFSLSYAKATQVQTNGTMLLAVLAGSAVAIMALPVLGVLAQQHGRKKLLVVGLALQAIWIFPTFWAIDSGSAVLVVLAYVVSFLLFAVSYAPQATFITELFDASVRYSASSASYQIGVMLGGAIAPLVATSLVAATGTSSSVSAYVAALSVLSLLCVLAVRQQDVDRASSDMTGTTGASTP